MELVIAIIGIIATLLIGFAGIIFSKKYSGKVLLSFVEHERIALFRTIVKDLNNVEVKFRGNPVSENIILFSGSLIKTGNRDIDKSMMHKPFSVCISKKFKLLDANITDHSSDIAANCEIVDEQKMNLKWDLLKKDEFISFNSLVEYLGDTEMEGEEKNKSLAKIFDVEFEHRITNLSKIGWKELPLKKKSSITIFPVAPLFS